MEFIKVIHERRAVNFFDPSKPVSDDELKRIIETASLAPSGFNLQPWRLIVVKSQADRERLKAVAWNQPKIAVAPVVLIVIGDKDGWKSGHPTMEKTLQNMIDLNYVKAENREVIKEGMKVLYDDPEKSIAFACKNTGFFAMSIMLAVKDAGLDSHPMDGFDYDGVKKAFDIPDNFYIPMLLAIGHFDRNHELGPPKWRKSYEDIVFKSY